MDANQMVSDGKKKNIQWLVPHTGALTKYSTQKKKI